MNTPAGTAPDVIVKGFLEAVATRDVDAVLGFFAPDATWQNVPSEPGVGHDGIRAMLTPILTRSDKVQWDIVTEAYSVDRAWLERVDRFFIDGIEYAVQCNGVLEFDTDAGVITELRDYVDLGEWRTRTKSITWQ